MVSLWLPAATAAFTVLFGPVYLAVDYGNETLESKPYGQVAFGPELKYGGQTAHTRVRHDPADLLRATSEPRTPTEGGGEDSRPTEPRTRAEPTGTSGLAGDGDSRPGGIPPPPSGNQTFFRKLGHFARQFGWGLATSPWNFVSFVTNGVGIVTDGWSQAQIELGVAFEDGLIGGLGNILFGKRRNEAAWLLFWSTCGFIALSFGIAAALVAYATTKLATALGTTAKRVIEISLFPFLILFRPRGQPPDVLLHGPCGDGTTSDSAYTLVRGRDQKGRRRHLLCATEHGTVRLVPSNNKVRNLKVTGFEY